MRLFVCTTFVHVVDMYIIWVHIVCIQKNGLYIGLLTLYTQSPRTKSMFTQHHTVKYYALWNKTVTRLQLLGEKCVCFNTFKCASRHGEAQFYGNFLDIWNIEGVINQCAALIIINYALCYWAMFAYRLVINVKKICVFYLFFKTMIRLHASVVLQG